MHNIICSGDFAYVSTGETGLSIYDVSDPENAFEVGGFDPQADIINAAILDSTTRLICLGTESSGLLIVDASNPSEPIQVGACDFPGSIYDICVNGNYAYVSNHEYGLRVIDFSNPQLPVDIGLYTVPGHTEYVECHNNYLFLTNNNSGINDGLIVFDISNPFSLIYVGLLDIMGDTGNMDIINDYIYIISNDNYCIGIVDINNAILPNIVGTIETEGLCSGLVISDSVLFIEDHLGNGYGIYIYDISNPTNPVFRADHPIQSWPYHITASNDVLYIGFKSVSSYTVCWLQLIDVSDPSSPSDLTTCGNKGRIYYSAINDSIAFVTLQRGGLGIVNIENPSAPFEIINMDINTTKDLVLIDEYLYLAVDCGLYAIDVSDPYNPSIIGAISLGIVPLDHLFVANNIAYIVQGSDELTMIDINDPSSLVLIASYDTNYLIDDLYIEDNYAFVAADNSGYLILDVSDPYSVFEVSISTVPGNANDVALENGFSYVVTSAGLSVFDISDPYFPEDVGFLSIPGFARQIEIQESFAYLAMDSGGLHIVNINNPIEPVEVGFYETPGTARGVDVMDGYAYVSDFYYYHILDCRDAIGWEEPPNLLEVSLTAQNPLIVPRGSSFQYEALVTSNLPSPYNVDFWTYVSLPNGSPYGPLQRINNVPMTPTTIIGPVNLGLAIPQTAVLGEYTFHMQAGRFPATVVGEDEFPFEVVAATGTNGLPSSDWSAWGLDQLHQTSSEETVTDVATPTTYSLAGAYPNPFNASTTLTVNLPEIAELTVVVYNTLGQEVVRIADGTMSAGRHDFTFNASTLSSGVYFVQVQVPGKLDELQKVVLMK